MNWTTKKILAILDDASRAFTFPALDNGYIYPAAARLSLFRGHEDWALVIETFGFSPRAGWPDCWISTFGSRVLRGKGEKDFVNQKAYENYLKHHPHDEPGNVFPISEGDWIDQEDGESVAGGERMLTLRGREIEVPDWAEVLAEGIDLEAEGSLRVWELCRYLAAKYRAEILATDEEQRMRVPPELTRILVLDDWYHANIVAGEMPSECKSFQQLADVLVTGDVKKYQPKGAGNTHWKNWPLGGTL